MLVPDFLDYRKMVALSPLIESKAISRRYPIYRWGTPIIRNGLDLIYLATGSCAVSLLKNKALPRNTVS